MSTPTNLGKRKASVAAGRRMQLLQNDNANELTLPTAPKRKTNMVSMGTPKIPRTVAELQIEVQSLHEVVNKLQLETIALKQRLNEVEYLQKFRLDDCKKWLIENYDFDRKDSPELLANIFESYLLQVENIEILPHQVLVKNSVRRQARRNLEKTKDSIPSPVEVQVDPEDYDLLYEKEPWQLLIEKWPKPTSNVESQASIVQALERAQEEFLKENACAIWERNHWVPLKQECASNEEQAKELGIRRNRRKRRQGILKLNLEKALLAISHIAHSPVIEKSIFSSGTIALFMKKPRSWYPKPGIPLIKLLSELDAQEPDRNFHLVD